MGHNQFSTSVSFLIKSALSWFFLFSWNCLSMISIQNKHLKIALAFHPIYSFSILMAGSNHLYLWFCDYLFFSFKSSCLGNDFSRDHLNVKLLFHLFGWLGWMLWRMGRSTHIGGREWQPPPPHHHHLQPLLLLTIIIILTIIHILIPGTFTHPPSSYTITTTISHNINHLIYSQFINYL